MTEPIHTTITISEWNIFTWNNDEIDFTEEGNLLETIDKFNGTHEVTPTFTQKKLNVITTRGLREMSRSRLPGTSITRTFNTHHAVGIGTRLENLDDRALQTQIAIKEIISAAEQSGAERYATFFNYGDVGNTNVNLREFGIFTAATGGVLFCRTTTDQAHTVDSTSTVTVTTKITHRNGTQIPT